MTLATFATLLADRADVSTRHLSCVETGRARPTAAMIERLADHLEIPPQERNTLLLAGGFAPHYGHRPLDDAVLAPVLDGLRALLDAHAPGVYGGTGRVFDWSVAVDFKRRHPDLPVVLAGGIVPENAADAARAVSPAALDIASGAEHSPGLKDMAKVSLLIKAHTKPYPDPILLAAKKMNVSPENCPGDR